MPLSIVIGANITEHLELISIDYGIHGHCWIYNTTGSAAFFAAPICWVVLTNGIMYVKTISSIRYVAKKMKSNGVPTQKNRGRKDFFIYLRMFTILSFNWIFGILTWSIPENSPEYLMRIQDIFVGIFVVLTGANGIFICFIFTLNKRVFGLYFKAMKKYSWTFPWAEKKIVKPIKTWRRNRKISAQSQMSKISTLTQTTSIFHFNWTL